MKKGINKRNLDTAADLRDDFYLYSCGGWIERHPMKEHHSRYGMFDFIRDKASKQLKELVKTLGENPDAHKRGTIANKINVIYNQVLDKERLKREGASPIIPLVEKLEKDKLRNLSRLISKLHHGYSDVFFGAGVTVGAADSNAHIFGLTEVGLTLGDRDYYLEDNEKNREILEEYFNYIEKIMQLVGYSKSESERIRKTVEKMEREFASHKHTREERRDPTLRYNVFSVDELKKRYTFLDWDLYFKELNVNPEKVNITNPAFFDFLNEYIKTLTPREIKDYFIYDVVSDASGLLGEKFEKLNFRMFGQVMSGAKRRTPRWEKALGMVNSMFGEAIGQLYVEKYFPKANKDYMVELVNNLKTAFASHIENEPWMTDETKGKALEKLNALTIKIGYPDKWRDYSEIKIDERKSLWENVFKASLWFINDNLAKLGKPVDKEEWFMYPQTVNAYYSPVNNEICFPAGILQAPYFDIKNDDALNYGAIGVVIGHEMTHGFDDQGHQFDKDGNLKNWWTQQDEERFKKLTHKLVEQFNAVEIAPGVHANGEFTLGENIADQGGLRIALTAYRNKVKECGAEEDLGGYSPEQRFYLSYAGIWASNQRDEEKVRRVKTDPHSLEENRVNVTLKNISDFINAFDIKEGDKMYRPENERVVIW